MLETKIEQCVPIIIMFMRRARNTVRAAAAAVHTANCHAINLLHCNGSLSARTFFVSYSVAFYVFYMACACHRNGKKINK